VRVDARGAPVEVGDVELRAVEGVADLVGQAGGERADRGEPLLLLDVRSSRARSSVMSSPSANTDTSSPSRGRG
jgi:hypothetical protein